MALKGDLKSVGLADVFQMLALNRKEGILAIVGSEAKRALFFDSRGVTLYYNEHSFLDRLLDILVRKLLISPDVLLVLRRENSGDPIATVESVLGGGIVSEEVFLKVFRELMEEEIYDLFLWENVHWEFHEGIDHLPEEEGVINENFFLTPDSIIMEAARRLDEWAFIRKHVTSGAEVFSPVPGVPPPNEEIGGEDILEFVDGKRTVDRIIELSGQSAFHVFKVLSGYVVEGCIQPQVSELYLEMADACEEEGRLGDAINLVEKAIQMGIGLPEAHLTAGRIYEAEEERAKANWHFKIFAEERLQEGETDQAVEVLQNCLENIPTDLDAYELLLKGLLLQRHPRTDPYEVGKDLIDLYLELDETDRARKVLEGLLQVRPADIELKKTLVAVHSKAGDTKRVMELYESIAADLVKAKDPIGAVKFLQKILMIDRSRRDISDQIKQLYVMDERARSRQRSRFLVLASLICFGVIGSLYFLYEQNVRNSFKHINTRTFENEKKYVEAISIYMGFRKRNPLSWTAHQLVTERIAELEAKKAVHDAELESLRHKRDKKAAEKRKRYMRLWNEYHDLFEVERDISKALTRLQKILAIIEEAGQEQDFEFRSRQKLIQEERTLRRHLKDAAAKELRVKEEIAKGRIQRARKMAFELHEKFPYSPSARRTRIPFEIRTEPPGAQIHLRGLPLEDEEGNPLRTPTTLGLPYDKPVKIELVKKGYQRLVFRAKGADPSPYKVILRVKPERILELPDDAVTGMSLRGSLGLVGLREGRLLALDLSTGREKFEFQLPGIEEVRSRPILFGDVGIISTTRGMLRAISVVDGTEAWKVEVEGSIATGLVETRDGVLLITTKGSMKCFDPMSGQLLWTHETRLPPVMDPGTWNNKVWYGDTEGRLWVLDTDGEVLRTGRLKEGIQAGPVPIGDLIVVYGSDGKLRAVDGDYEEVWRKTLGAPHSKGALVPDKHGLVFSDQKGRVLRFDAETGRILAKRSLPGELEGVASQLGRTLFFLSRKEGALYITSFEGPDLSVRWEYRLDKGLRGRPAAMGDTLILVGTDRKVRFLK